MPGLPLKLATAMGVDLTTIRRWLRKGFVPGAYRTKGGHWRLRGRLTLKTAILIQERILKYTGRPAPPPKFVKPLLDTLQKVLSPQNLTAYEMFLAMYGLTHKTIFTEKLTEELQQKIFEEPFCTALSSELVEAASEPVAKLYLAALIIVNRTELKPTARALAKELKITTTTLYRKYRATEIRKAKNQFIKHYELKKECPSDGKKRTINRER